jgi:hypothetical protein
VMVDHLTGAGEITVLDHHIDHVAVRG